MSGPLAALAAIGVLLLAACLIGVLLIATAAEEPEGPADFPRLED